MSEQPSIKVVAPVLRTGSPMTRGRTGEIVGTLIIAALLFVPIRSCLNEKSGDGYHGRSGYGRRSDLRQIGMAIEMYADDNGSMPSTLWDLHGQYIDSPRLLASPGDLEPREGGGEWTLDRYHYLYEGGARPSDIPAGAPLVVYPHSYGDGVAFSVLFKYGSVELLREEEFLDRLARNGDGGARP